MPDQPISRRVLLGGAAAVLLGGCDDEAAEIPPRPPSGSPSQQPSGDERLVARAVRSARQLTGAYAALSARHPDTRRTTAPLTGHLAEHLTAWGQSAKALEQPRADRSKQQAVATMLSAEREASGARLADAVAAESGELARVLASVAAAHAQHVVVLQGLVRS